LMKMKEERLTKKITMQAMEMCSRNLVDDTRTIMETHNMMYSDEDVVNMTKNQWKKLIERNLADVVNKRNNK